MAMATTTLIPARVKDVKWLLVGREGQAFGYVYAPLLRPARSAAATAAMSLGLRDPESADSGSSESDKPSAGAEAETLTARTPCRNVLYNLAPEGGDAHKYRFRACKAGDGAWQITPRTVAESND